MGSAAFGRLIREQRFHSGLDQASLAAQAGISASYVSKIERGRVKSLGADLLRNLAGALHVPQVELERALYDRAIPATIASGPLLPVEVAVVAQAHVVRGWEGVVEQYVYVPRAEARGLHLRAVRATEECVEPEIGEGDVVIIAVNEPLQDGHLVLATLWESGKTLVKRFRGDSQGELYSSGDPSKVIPVGNVRIEGVVIEVRHKVQRERPPVLMEEARPPG